jgi:hypothetical protein
MDNTARDIATVTDRASISRYRDTCHDLLLFFDHVGADLPLPYQIQEGVPVQPAPNLSFSTTAMVLHALSVSTGSIRKSALVPAVRTWEPLKSTARITALTAGAAQTLYDNLVDEPAPGVAGAPRLTHSSTWGWDDPLSLMWFYEIVGAADPQVPAAIVTRLHTVAQQRISDAFANPSSPVLRGDTFGSGAAPVSHVFPLLRLVQLYQSAPAQLGTDVAETATLQKHLLDQLHLQLSFSAIRDSDFDPAQLVFALEALLTLNSDIAERSLIDRVVEVLHESQPRNPYWRPIRPLTINPQGMILLPQSVEVANSLLRICSILDSEHHARSCFSESLDLLRTYSDWLESRGVKGNTGAWSFEGWQSEHTHTPGLVHLWATSQVLLFFEHYAAMLQDHIARQMRESVGMSVATQVPQDSPESFWTDDVATKEPLTSLPAGSALRVYDNIWNRFVRPRLGTGSVKDAHYSMVIYGPPGTGKTKLAQDISMALGSPLITITPSDFIEKGEAGVETRARELFDVLAEQHGVVVLFDEIDRLVLDRDSDQYGEQSDMFQFMTPGMLTKLQSLRDGKQAIFIISTNYFERIDTAIKRPGRIDDHVLVLPPDRAQRRRILTKYLEDSGLDLAGITDAVWKAVTDSTVLCIYKELTGVCDQAINLSENAGTPLHSALEEVARNSRPGISRVAYRSRFLDDEKRVRNDLERCPTEEFVMLSYLVAEVQGNLYQEAWMKEVLREGLDRGIISDPSVVAYLRAEMERQAAAH